MGRSCRLAGTRSPERPVVVGRVWRRAFVVNAELVEHGLGRSGELASAFRVNDANPDIQGGDVRVDDVDKRPCGVAVTRRDMHHLDVRAVLEAQHRIPAARKGYLIKEAGEVDDESLRTSISPAIHYVRLGLSPHPGFRVPYKWDTCSP